MIWIIFLTYFLTLWLNTVISDAMKQNPPTEDYLSSTYIEWATQLSSARNRIILGPINTLEYIGILLRYY